MMRKVASWTKLSWRKRKSKEKRQNSNSLHEPEQCTTASNRRKASSTGHARRHTVASTRNLVGGGGPDGGPDGGHDGSRANAVLNGGGARRRPSHPVHGLPGPPEPGGRGRRSVARRNQLDHMELFFSTDFEDLIHHERLMEWFSSFRRCDPRYLIMKFFNDVAQGGADNVETSGISRSELVSPILRAFRRAAVFTVWRPTSIEAIQKMMLRRGTGKGLDIKGKSAKQGKLSAYVPFLQIWDEQHKEKIKKLPKDARIRVFYRKEMSRDQAIERLEVVSKEMVSAVAVARSTLEQDDADEERRAEASKRIEAWEMEDPSVKLINDYALNKGWGPFAKCVGLDIAERLFWEAYVMREDISREPDSEYDTGRASEPAYQDMNFASTRNWKKDQARAVVWQYANPKEGEGPMDPRTLLVAYEENNIVLPVVSDFDCFLVGTRGVTYEKPIPSEQVDLVNWCVTHIEKTLDNPTGEPWVKRWLDVLRYYKPKGKGVHMPKFGYGDPKSYSIMGYAAGELKESGAVRHGAECFNFYFPQDLDNEYLVIFGDADSGQVPWKYVNEQELRDILCQKIDKGFTFPLNPKWILCDKGWKEVYDKLRASERPNVQDSLNCWYPPDSGLRERFEEIHSRHPDGFKVTNGDLQKGDNNDSSVDLGLDIPRRRSMPKRLSQFVYMKGSVDMDIAEILSLKDGNTDGDSSFADMLSLKDGNNKSVRW